MTPPLPEEAVMAEEKTGMEIPEKPELRNFFSGALTRINTVIAILIFVGLGLAADAFLHAGADFALDRNPASFAQELNEELSTSFVGGSAGLIIAALLFGFVFVVFEAPMRLYWAVLGCGSAYISWLYFGGRALGQ